MKNGALNTALSRTCFPVPTSYPAPVGGSWHKDRINITRWEGVISRWSLGGRHCASVATKGLGLHRFNYYMRSPILVQRVSCTYRSPPDQAVHVNFLYA